MSPQEKKRLEFIFPTFWVLIDKKGDIYIFPLVLSVYLKFFFSLNTFSSNTIQIYEQFLDNKTSIFFTKIPICHHEERKIPQLCFTTCI